MKCAGWVKDLDELSLWARSQSFFTGHLSSLLINAVKMCLILPTLFWKEERYGKHNKIAAKSVNNHNAKVHHKNEYRRRTRAKTAPRFVKKMIVPKDRWQLFDTLTTTFNHPISRLVIGVKNPTSITGDDKSEGKAEEQRNRFDCWRGRRYHSYEYTCLCRRLIIPAFLIQTAHDWLGWTSFHHIFRRN